MTYRDPADIHVPATGDSVPVAWLTTVSTSITDLARPQGAFLRGFASVDSGSATALDTDIEWVLIDRLRGDCADETTVSAPVDGWWAFTAVLSWEADASGLRFARLLNDTTGSGISPTWRISAAGGGNETWMTCIFDREMGPSFDPLKLSVGQNSGSTLQCNVRAWWRQTRRA